jgi:hypothetical protein
MIKLKDTYQYPPKVEGHMFSELVYIIDEFEECGAVYFDYNYRVWKQPDGEDMNVDFKWFFKPSKVKYND